ncbi:glycosyltransferase [Candidatus Desantisbacteria bacterium]|nr:glycosyltransferase [Candidatus Desantisbacteria bacterium]
MITLKPEPMRITGMITWATAMAMGKVVIVTEPFGASDYMEHGVSGFIVKYGDADALKYYINLVMSDQKLRKKIGNEAKSRSWQQSNPEVFRKKILTLLENKDKI